MNTSKKQIIRSGETRRDFIKKTAAATAGIVTAPMFSSTAAVQPLSRVAIWVDTADPVCKERPVQWAVHELERELKARKIPVSVGPVPADEPAGTARILVAGRGSPSARAVLEGVQSNIPGEAEAWALVPGQVQGKPGLLVSGSDVRGLVYSVLEVADMVQYGDNPLRSLGEDRITIQQPANRIRSIARLFSSDVEDKAWFYDKVFWQEYLSMLVRHRFNRFNLTLGLGYNSPRRVPDSYFYFAYPFLVSVPGHDVRAVGLPDSERDRNLEMLQWIGDETIRRGLHFQLALWTHAYDFIDSPKVNYPIAGLTPRNHAAYCRDALRQLLEACPAIGGITFRSHSESGIPEGSYEFWRTVFDGVRRAGRKTEIDIHSKGIEHKLLDMALETGMPVNVSPKYWAEHMGLPYHQAAIRELEWAKPRPGGRANIEGARRFTRYGYADYLREDRRFGVLYRIWPGTQRLLLSGDPALVAGYGRFAHFCGSDGLELCEPLSFKGRMGSGLPGRRDGHADPARSPEARDWKKHLYTYRLWGRLLYEPETTRDSWERFLKAGFGAAALSCEKALANASRILPLITTAHLPSASNNAYWPEIYTNMPIVDAARPHPYGDSPSPKRFGTVSSIDPAFFSAIDEFAAECVSGDLTGKYSPLDAARWLRRFAANAEQHLAKAKEKIDAQKHSGFRAWTADISIQAGLGRFFAEKFRAGVAFSVYEKTHHRGKLAQALQHYRAAREAWAKLAAAGKGAYEDDLTFGTSAHLRGHWADRLPAIEQDLADMEKELKESSAKLAGRAPIPCKVDPFAEPATRPVCQHLPPEGFRRGAPIRIELGVESGYRLTKVRLHYRPVNQGEAYQILEMAGRGSRYQATIPAAATEFPFSLLYYFELHDPREQAWLFPGFNPELSNQPYYVLRPAIRI